VGSEKLLIPAVWLFIWNARGIGWPWRTEHRGRVSAKTAISVIGTPGIELKSNEVNVAGNRDNDFDVILVFERSSVSNTVNCNAKDSMPLSIRRYSSLV